MSGYLIFCIFIIILQAFLNVLFLNLLFHFLYMIYIYIGLSLFSFYNLPFFFFCFHSFVEFVSFKH